MRGWGMVVLRQLATRPPSKVTHAHTWDNQQRGARGHEGTATNRVALERVGGVQGAALRGDPENKK